MNDPDEYGQRFHRCMPPPPNRRPSFLDEMDPGAVAIFESIRHLHKLQMSAFAALLQRHGLSRSQGFCIKALENREGVSQSELAELMGISRATATVMLQKMESAGLVRRSNDPGDARIARVYLTEQARQANTRAENEFTSLFRQAFSLPPDQHAVCLSALRRIAEVFENAVKENKTE